MTVEKRSSPLQPQWMRGQGSNQGGGRQGGRVGGGGLGGATLVGGGIISQSRPGRVLPTCTWRIRCSMPSHGNSSSGTPRWAGVVAATQSGHALGLLLLVPLGICSIAVGSSSVSCCCRWWRRPRGRLCAQYSSALDEHGDGRTPRRRGTDPGGLRGELGRPRRAWTWSARSQAGW